MFKPPGLCSPTWSRILVLKDVQTRSGPAGRKPLLPVWDRPPGALRSSACCGPHVGADLLRLTLKLRIRGRETGRTLECVRAGRMA